MNFITEEQYKIAEKNNINRNVAFKRVYYLNWSIEKAITTPIRRKITTQQLIIAKKNGITAKCVSVRVNIHGWDIEKAITTPMVSKGYI